MSWVEETAVHIVFILIGERVNRTSSVQLDQSLYTMSFYKEAQLLVQCLETGKLQSSLLSNSKYVSNPDITTIEPNKRGDEEGDVKPHDVRCMS